eukprot:CAMPEP_0117614074 /NCGR_PEP_ID=MMETSP0784-20121206/83829_1 /TAXON_ID=39447 /ORGANISM="" /LENGTH=165 /DNA_ID=CAMNT_0005417753 /DNA_START=12 /DNA_END=506 /DNA_ORIENTATION=+
MQPHELGAWVPYGMLVVTEQCTGNDCQTARALRVGEGSRGFLAWSDRWARTAVHWATLNGHIEAVALLLEHNASPEPPQITDHQMGKRTHMTQETPLAIAKRIHGEGSTIAQLLMAAIAAKRGEPAAEPKRAEVPAEPVSEYLVTIAEPRLEKLALWELRERLSA